MNSSLCKKLIGLLFIIFTLISPNLHADERGDTLSRKLELSSKYGSLAIELHGYEVDKHFIERVEGILTESASKLFEYFQYVPQDTIHFQIESDVQMANGAAAVFPRNYILLYNYPPVSEGHLAGSDDWLRILVLHELTHIIQMDMTTGYQQVLRTIFGSIGKWGMIVPRWFTEGIAVWAETEFTKEGRGRNISAEMEFDYIIDRGTYCNEISCLDQPGKYPYGSFPYWVGGWFMKYLEMKKPGTIRCLIKENSHEIPFFLNDVFIKCTGSNAERQYQQFIDYRLKELRRKQGTFKHSAISSESSQIELPRDGALFWQKGAALVGDRFFYSSVNDRVDRFNYYDLGTTEHKEFRLDQRALMILAPTEYQKKKSELSFGLTKIEGHDYQTIWRMVDAKNGKTKSSIQEDSDSEYLFKVGDGVFYSLRFEENRWNLYDNDNLIYAFEKFRTVNRPAIVEDGKNQFLVFKSHYGERFELQVFGIQSKIRKNIFSSSRSFNLVGNYGKYFFINRPYLRDDKLLVLHMNQQNFTSSFEGADSIARLYFSKKRVLFTTGDDPTAIYLFNGKANQFIQFLQGRYEGRFSKSSGKPEERELAMKLKDEDFESYPSADHFLPKFWFFDVTFGGELQKYSVFTFINDPMSVHSASLSMSYYPKLNDFVPEGVYQYEFMRYNFLGVDRQKTYSWSEFRNDENYTDSKTISLTKDMRVGQWAFPSMFSYSFNAVQDYVSPNGRDEQVSAVALSAHHIPSLTDSFVNQFSFLVSPFHQQTDLKNFFGVNTIAKTSLYLHDRLRLRFKGSWGRLFKDSIDGGVLSGGGTEEEAMHSFYGIAGSEIIGNKIYTARAQIDFKAHEIFDGWGFVPFYLRNIHYLAGYDQAKSDFVFVDNEIITEGTVRSIHAGLSFDMTLFYYAPITFDILYSKVLEQDVTSTLLVIRGGIF